MAAYTTVRDDLASIVAQYVSELEGTPPDLQDYAIADRIITRLDRHKNGAERIRITGWIGADLDAIKALRAINDDITLRRATKMLASVPFTIVLNEDVTLEQAEAYLVQGMVDYRVL